MNIRDTERIRHNTKIIATLGPGSNNVELLRDMIIAGGLNVIRFNFSHGDAEFHRTNAEIVREAARQARQEVAIMADLQGPKIRIGKIAGGGINVKAGETLLLDAAWNGEGGRECIGLDYRELPDDVKSGDVLLLDDGLLTLSVTEVNGSEIRTVAQNDHFLKSNKGINKQGGGLSAGSFTEKDFRDLKTAIGIGFLHDYTLEKNKGAPLELVVPCEGTGYELGGVSILKGARNMDNAKLFVDWALSKEGQESAWKQGESLQILTNTTAEQAPNTPDPAQLKLIDYDFAKYGSADERKRLIDKWVETVKMGK